MAINVSAPGSDNTSVQTTEFRIKKKRANADAVEDWRGKRDLGCWDVGSLGME